MATKLLRIKVRGVLVCFITQLEIGSFAPLDDDDGANCHFLLPALIADHCTAY